MVFNTAIYNLCMETLLLLFTNFSFISIEQTIKYILNIVQKEDPKFSIDAYTGKLVLYTSILLWMPFSLNIINKIGARPAIIIATILHLSYGVQFLYIANWSYLLGCILVGCGNTLLTLATKRYFAQNSSDLTILKFVAMSVILALLEGCSRYSYFFFRFPERHINESKRREFFYICLESYILAVVFSFTLFKAVFNTPNEETVKETFSIVFSLLRRKDTWLMVPIVMYGAFNRIWREFRLNGIFFTKKMKHAPSAMRVIAEINVIGILCSAINGLVLTFAGTKITSLTRGYDFPLVLLGFVFDLMQMLMDVVNLPDSSPHGETDEEGMITSNYIIALFSEVIGSIMCLCIIKSKTGMLFKMYSLHVSHAFVMARCFQTVGSVISLVLIHFVGFYFMTLFTISWGVFSVATFSLCEINFRHSSEYLNVR